MTLQELLEKKAKLALEIKRLAAKAQDKTSDWSTADESEWDAVNARYDENEAELAAHEKRTADAFKRLGITRGTGNPGREDNLNGLDKILRRQRTIGAGPSFRSAETGREIRALTSGEQFAELQAADDDDETPSVGRCVAALLGVRDIATSSEMRAAIGSSDTNGGYLLTPTLSGLFVDLARSSSVALRAGAMTLPMDSREVAIARLTADPSAVWRAEGQRIAASTPAFDRVTLRAKTLAAIVPISIELLEDASNIVGVIENALSSALGLALDRAVLSGAGAASEPLGILNHASVNSIASVGALTDYSDVSSAIGQIYTANYPGEPSGLAWIMNPREATTLNALEDSTGQPLQPTPWAAGVRKFMTSSLSIVEGGGAESSMVVGDFSQCIIGMRTTGVRLEIFRDGSATDAVSVTTNGLSDLMVHIRAYLRCDVALLRPTWFTKLSGITA